MLSCAHLLANPVRGAGQKESIMKLNRHAEALHQDRMQRWEHENEYLRPYTSIGLTTRTQGTSYALSSPSGEIVVVTPGGTRRLHLPHAGIGPWRARGRSA